MGRLSRLAVRSSGTLRSLRESHRIW